MVTITIADILRTWFKENKITYKEASPTSLYVKRKRSRTSIPNMFIFNRDEIHICYKDCCKLIKVTDLKFFEKLEHWIKTDNYVRH